VLEGGPIALRHRNQRIVVEAGAERRVAEPAMAPEAWTKSLKAVAASEAQRTGA
jgi:hypothetical protein